jgi:hypothetical protein
VDVGDGGSAPRHRCRSSCWMTRSFGFLATGATRYSYPGDTEASQWPPRPVLVSRAPTVHPGRVRCRRGRTARETARSRRRTAGASYQALEGPRDTTTATGWPRRVSWTSSPASACSTISGDRNTPTRSAAGHDP